MSRQRLTTLVALFALGSSCALAPAAWASSTLLSGYGGPGEGNQAILGSTLIGGGGGSRGGGGSSGTGGGGTPQAVSIEATSATGTRGSGSGSGSGAGGGSPRAHARRHAPAPPSTRPRTEAPAKLVVVRHVSAPALGLGGSDIAFIVLAALVLALTAAVTVLLARGSGSAQGPRGETGSG